MPLKEKLDNPYLTEDDDLALTILAGYKEGIEKKEQEEAKIKKD